MPIDGGVLKRNLPDNGDSKTGIETLKEKLTKLERDLGEDTVKEMKVLSKQIRELDPQKCEHTYGIVLAWAKKVLGLKTSLQEQQRLSKALREEGRIQDDKQDDSAQDEYRFTVDRLKADIRFFYNILQEFMDLPQDFSQQKRTWDHCIYDMEVALKSISGKSAEEDASMSVDVLASLLNYRDKVLHLMLSGLLFQKAVLDWDLKNARAYADGPMVSKAEEVVDFWSKHETLPDKYRVADLPAANDVGPFTFSSKNKQQGTVSCSAGCHTFVTVLREMRSQDRSLRQMAFDTQVQRKANEESNAVDLLRDEMEKWFDKCTKLEKDFRKTTEAGEVENKVKELAEKDRKLKQQVNRVHKLEGDLQGLKHELTTLRREKAELAERNVRMAKDSLPVLEQFKRVLKRSEEASDALGADVENLSAMFQMQTEENKSVQQETGDIGAELGRVYSQVQVEQERNKTKEQKLQKTETLYLRVMAARRSIHDSLLEHKAQIREMEQRMEHRDMDRQELLKVLEGRDSDILQLQEDLRRSHGRVEELKNQVKMCLREHYQQTGTPPEEMLQRFRHKEQPPRHFGEEVLQLVAISDL